MLPHSEESIAIRAIGIIRRRALVAMAVFATVVAAAVAFALYLPDLYKAHATVIVERPLAESVVRPTVDSGLESRLYVIQQTILSRDRLSELVNRFHLYPELRKKGSFEDVLNQAREDIQWKPNGPEQVNGRNKTVTFNLSYIADNPEMAAEVTNAVAGFYIASNGQMRTSEAKSASQFMRQQVDDASAQVNLAETKLRSFVAANQSQLPQAAAVNAVTYTRLGDDLRRVRDDQQRARDALNRAEEAMTEATGVAAGAAGRTTASALGVEPSKEMKDLNERLDKARTELTAMTLKGWADAHPEVRSARDRIASLEREVDAQAERDLAAYQAAKVEEQRALATGNKAEVARVMPRSQRSVESYKEDLERLQKREAEIVAEMNGLLARFDGAPGVQNEYVLLQRDYQAAKDNFDQVQRRYEDAKLAEGVETSGQGERFRVLEAAIPPEGPSAPNRLRLIIMGLLLALAAGGAAVVAAEQLDTSFHTIDDLREFTAIPVLATIPQIGRAPRRGYLRLVLGTISAVAAIVLVGTLSAYLATGNETLVRLLQRAG